jgi:hypothetical protein
MKRRHELICQTEFEKLFAATFPDLAFTWHEPEVDPPDWYLDVGESRFAVEATSVTEIFTLGGTQIPSPGVYVSLASFVNDLEETARSQGILSGSYLVCLSPIPNFPQHRASLESQFMAYIKDTQNLASAPLLFLGFIGNNEVSIQKVGGIEDRVAEAISMEAKSGGQAREELKSYLDAALATKTHKLRAVQEPTVLPILDDFHYSHVADWRTAIAQSPDRASFSAIVRISPPDDSSVIWPTDASWLP